MYKKVAIFPVNHETVALVRYAYIGKFEPIALVAPELSILDGEDISKLDGGSPSNIILCSNYTQGIQNCEAVIFLGHTDEEVYKELMLVAKAHNREIWTPGFAQENIKREVTTLASDGDISLANDLIPQKLLNIDTPIISIYGIGYNCGILHTEFLARDFFMGNGYKVLQIGSVDYSQYLGCVAFPSFIFDSNLNYTEKAIKFNRFIFDLEKEQNPDVIIIGTPNPIMKYSDDVLNGLGIVPFIIQNSIKSDIGIVNLYYSKYDFEYIEMISQLTRFRFNIPFRYFGLSNVNAHKNQDMDGKMEYLHLETSFVKSNFNPEIGNDKYTIYPAYDKDSAYETFRKIEAELQSNVLRI